MICKHCGKTNIKRPIKDDQGNLIWKNLIIPDASTIFFILLVLFCAWAYQHDVEACFEVVERPCTYAARQGCCTDPDQPFTPIKYENISIDITKNR